MWFVETRNNPHDAFVHFSQRIGTANSYHVTRISNGDAFVSTTETAPSNFRLFLTTSLMENVTKIGLLSSGEHNNLGVQPAERCRC
jgi:hypothetical protein